MIAEHEIYWLTEPDFWKTTGGPNLGQMGQNRAFSFSKVCFISFPWKKILWTKFGPKRAKIRPKISFFAISFPLHCIGWERHVLLTTFAVVWTLDGAKTAWAEEIKLEKKNLQ